MKKVRRQRFINETSRYYREYTVKPRPWMCQCGHVSRGFECECCGTVKE